MKILSSVMMTEYCLGQCLERHGNGKLREVNMNCYYSKYDDCGERKMVKSYCLYSEYSYYCTGCAERMRRDRRCRRQRNVDKSTRESKQDFVHRWSFASIVPKYENLGMLGASEYLEPNQDFHLLKLQQRKEPCQNYLEQFCMQVKETLIPHIQRVQKVQEIPSSILFPDGFPIPFASQDI